VSVAVSNNLYLYVGYYR